MDGEMSLWGLRAWDENGSVCLAQCLLDRHRLATSPHPLTHILRKLTSLSHNISHKRMEFLGSGRAGSQQRVPFSFQIKTNQNKKCFIQTGIVTFGKQRSSCFFATSRLYARLNYQLLTVLFRFSVKTKQKVSRICLLKPPLTAYQRGFQHAELFLPLSESPAV